MKPIACIGVSDGLELVLSIAQCHDRPLFVWIAALFQSPIVLRKAFVDYKTR